jgi:hypothetical protein
MTALLVRTLSVVAPLLVLVGLWIPGIHRTYVATPALSDAALEAARRVPDDAMLAELCGAIGGDAALVPIADALLDGRVAIPGFAPTAIGMPFDPLDLDRGLPPWRLFLAGLGVAKILLQAQEITGDEHYLSAARDVILGWGRYERGAWLPRGHLWNDHAIAERLVTLSRFWSLYRRHPLYDHAAAREVLQFAARSAAALAKPAQFTFSTNHGVMQNLALLHFALAFPTLPLAERHAALAFARLRDQLRFHVSDEGVVLEHSPAYHRSGLARFGRALRYLTLLDVPIPAEWWAKYERAKAFYGDLRRPDDTLPVFGDTGAERESIGPLVTLVTEGDAGGHARPLAPAAHWRPTDARAFHPVSGYAVWWNGLDAWPDVRRLSQLAVGWSSFPGHAHRHADQMSMALWASGQTWWSNVGLWPIETRGRAEAVSWAGSNAPHLVGEPDNGDSDTRVLAFGWSTTPGFLELERRGAEPYVPRRQIAQASPTLWVVIDSTSDERTDATTTTTWTTAPDVTVVQGADPGRYDLVRAAGGAYLQAAFLGSPTPRLRELRGSFEPFAGWQMGGLNEPLPAPAIVLEQPAQASYAIAVWSLAGGGDAGLAGAPSLTEWAGAEQWSLVVPLAAGAVELQRAGATLRVSHGGKTGTEELALTRPPDYGPEQAAIRTAYAEAARKYRITGGRINQRRATAVLVALFVAAELVLFGYRRATGRSDTGLRALGLVGWAAAGLVLAIAVR